MPVVLSKSRTTVILVGALLMLPLLSTAAYAHVAVSSSDAVRGGEAAQLSFRVPTESATATTVKLTINLPISTPFGEVLVRSIPGWTVSTKQTKLPAPVKVGDFTLDKATTSVTWSGQTGTSIGVGQFQDFEILIGPLPDKPSVQFTADQVYSDGSVVRWDQPTPASGVEPDHPAPVLYLAATPPSGALPASSPSSGAASVAATPANAITGGASVSAARRLSETALTIGVLSLIVSLVSAVLVRRRPRPAA